MLIVEGADCLGKTTAINTMRKMCKDWNPPVLYSHMGRPNEDIFDFCDDYNSLMTINTIQDRFHLGGIVWHQRITEENLRMIEARLCLVGSVIVIFYCSDHRWYEKRIKQDKRGNLLDVDVIIEANMQYHLMVNKDIILPGPWPGGQPILPEYDFAWDLKSINMTEPAYPDEDVMKVWLNLWRKRRKVANGIFRTNY